MRPSPQEALKGQKPNPSWNTGLQLWHLQGPHSFSLCVFIKSLLWARLYSRLGEFSSEQNQKLPYSHGPAIKHLK